MKHGSLFSGIGGFDLAASWLEWDNVFQVEKDEWCRKVLAKNFPKTKRYSDIKEFNAKPYNGTIDIISGGFPCQPFSEAGKRKGKDDDRHLWPEMLRVISEVKPSYVVCENVTGIINLALDTVLADLEAQGYTTETFVIPACGIGATHRRNRVWIIAYAEGTRGWQYTGATFGEASEVRREIHNGRQAQQTYFPIGGFQDELWTEAAARICRMDDGLSRRLYRTKRLAGLGNAIVPQIAYEIFRVIDLIEAWAANTNTQDAAQ